MSGEAAADEWPIARPELQLVVGMLAFAVFTVVTTEFSVVGLLPALARDFGISLARAGWFVTAFAVAAAFVGPPLAMMAARYAPRRVLVATLLLFAIGNGIVALTQNDAVLLTVRIAQGCVLPVFASVAIVSATRFAGVGREGWAAARVNQGVVVTAVLGVPLAVIVADRIGWSASFAGLGLLGLIAAALIAIRFPSLEPESSGSPRIAASLLWRPKFLVHLVLSGLLFTAMFAAYTYIAPLLAIVANLDGVTVGWMLMGFGLAGILGNWIAGRVASPDPILATAFGAVILALVMAATGFAGAHVLLLALLIGAWGAAHTAAFVFCQVSAMTAGRDAPAFAMALNISVCNLGIALGALLGGSVVNRFGVEAAGYAGALLALAAVALAVAMIVGSRRKSARLSDREPPARA
jgi:predicted MFS family arabinose efflux permease